MSTGRLHCLRDEPRSGVENMARDEALLQTATLRPAVLRLYRWSQPTLSLGCFQRYADVAQLPEDFRSLAVVRRPTGGGAILHDQEITYALVLDETHPAAARSPTALYELVHACWRAVLAADGLLTELAPPHFPLPSPRSGPFFCFERPGRTDLIIGSDKLLGSAQRRAVGRVLQHGSLLLGQRFASHPGVNLGGIATERARRWEDAFARGLAAALGLEAVAAEWPAAELAAAAALSGKYGGAEWTQRR